VNDGGDALERELSALEASLRRRFRVIETVVSLSGHELMILHPESAEALIDERDFERDERLPYWAELWPSARVLAEQALALRGEGRSLLELGCGAGLVATCAALAGFRVCASDYYEDAIRFARVNAWGNGAGAIDARLLDWRTLPVAFETFDVIVASDVLYEKPYGLLVARALGTLLSENGLALLADPGRVGRDDFVRALGQHGLTVANRRDVAFVEGPVRQTITLYEVARG
jgi:predicted nicotinamide N-methyase